MLHSSLRRIIRKNSDYFYILSRQYPNFVLSDRVNVLDHIPVFTFHQESAEELELVFRFLAENGYQTLDADQLYEKRVSGVTMAAREVVLTFDDGHKSLWTIAYPLLKKYQLKAIAFILPGLTPDRDMEPPWKPGAQHLCNWEQIQDMHKSGTVDFQSHSMYHHSVFVSPRIVNYITPSDSPSFLQKQVFPVIEDKANVFFPEDLPLGTPIYESFPRYGSKRRYIENPEVTKLTTDFVTDKGGPDFFLRKSWKHELDKLVKSRAKTSYQGARFESAGERKNAILKDLRDAKRLIEARLSGKTVRHFCFPWYEGCADSAKLSAKAGYITNHWGWHLPREVLTCSTSILPVRRLDPQYIWRLPGKGRKSLTVVLRMRLARMRILHFTK